MEESNKTKKKDSNEMMTFEVIKLKLQLHIAEYSNLTGRCTYYMNIQSALVVGLIIWLTTIITIWTSSPTIIYVWVGICGFQLIEIILLGYVTDQYNIIRYLESGVRLQIKKLIKEDDVLQYESYNNKLRGNSVMVWEIAELIISCVLIIVGMVVRIKNGWCLSWDTIGSFKGWFVSWDTLGFFINIVLMLAIFIQSRDLISIRKNFENPI